MRLDRLDYIPILSTFNSVIRLIDVLTGRVHQFAVHSLYHGEEPSKAARLGRAFVTAIPGLNLLTIPYDLFCSHQTQPKDLPPMGRAEILGTRAPSVFSRSELFENGVYRPAKNDIVVYEYTSGFYIYGRVDQFSEVHPQTVVIDFGKAWEGKTVILPSPSIRQADYPVGPVYKLKLMTNDELIKAIVG